LESLIADLALATKSVNILCCRVSVEVGLGVGVAVAEGAGVGVGVAEGAGAGCALTFFHKSFFPDLMHVNFAPADTDTAPAFLQTAPAFAPAPIA
jgi:hypothetical protein